MANLKLTFSILPEKVGICHLDKNSPIPEWSFTADFFSITRTNSELSVICSQDKVPAGVLAEKDWRVLKVEGPLDLYAIGIIASLVKPMTEAGISILDISTYETEHILVEDRNLGKAAEILKKFCEIK